MGSLGGSFALAAVLVAQPPSAAEPDPGPEGLLDRQESGTLDLSAAVELHGLALDAGLAELQLLDGILVPVRREGLPSVEIVFLGRGRLLHTPPDSVERGQLERYTGAGKLDARFDEAVLVLGRRDMAAQLLARDRPEALEPSVGIRAEKTYEAWSTGGARRHVGAQEAILRGDRGDAAAAGFFAVWIREERLGEMVYMEKPDELEQVSLGRFVPIEASSAWWRSHGRRLERQQRKGRLIGFELSDLGRWETWVSSSYRDEEGRPLPGAPSFEPRHYSLEAEVTRGGDRLEGRARLDLETMARGARAVELRLGVAFEVERVLDDRGEELSFHRTNDRVTVFLPRTPRKGSRLALEVEYAGAALDHPWEHVFVMADPLGWYPHAGLVDRATYDLTIAWPARFELLASGSLVEEGKEERRRWVKRRVDVPVLGVSFEMGAFRKELLQVGHVALTVAANRELFVESEASFDEVVQAARESLGYFESLFGPYPLDELTLVTVPRDYSQGLLGFLTLSAVHLSLTAREERVYGVKDRRALVAHEMAHQWWGNQVDWLSYRDQWISEAVATYAAFRYCRSFALGTKDLDRGPTTGWVSELTRRTAEGRTVDSTGPLVLGERLLHSEDMEAYQAIVYKKGAVVLDMLGQLFPSDDEFDAALRTVVSSSSEAPLTTERFLSLIGSRLGRDLGPFADRFVFGTGMPRIYYDWQAEPLAGGGWSLTLRASQRPPLKDSFRLVRTPSGKLDVIRHRSVRGEPGSAALWVPVLVVGGHAEGSPLSDAGPAESEAALPGPWTQGSILVTGEENELRVELDSEPGLVLLDVDRRVLAQPIWAGEGSPSLAADRALALAAQGELREAIELLDRALPEVARGAPGRELYRELLDDRAAPELEAMIRLDLARLLARSGELARAGTALAEARRLLEDEGLKRDFRQDLGLLEARLDLLAGREEEAFHRLQRIVDGTEGRRSAESLTLLALAARAVGDLAAYQSAASGAEARGMDLTLLRDEDR